MDIYLAYFNIVMRFWSLNVKAPLTPPNFFHLIKFSSFPDYYSEKNYLDW